MSRRLMLVRHAKSSWADASLADHDRPLAARGENALPRLREHVAGSEHPIEVVICSTARRTVDTLDGFLDVLHEQVVVEIDRGVYGADTDEVLGRLRGVGERVGCVMVVGHNPTMQELTLLLAGSGRPDALAQVAAKFPTGAAVTLSFDGAWRDLAPGVAHLDDLFTPRPPRS